jgi:hypothetical protein
MLRRSMAVLRIERCDQNHVEATSEGPCREDYRLGVIGRLDLQPGGLVIGVD